MAPFKSRKEKKRNTQVLVSGVMDTGLEEVEIFRGERTGNGSELMVKPPKPEVTKHVTLYGTFT